MSLPLPEDDRANNLLMATNKPQQELPPLEIEATSSSSRERNSSSNNNNNAPVSHWKSKIEESDEDLFTVPDVEARPPASSNSTIINKGTNSNVYSNQEVQPAAKRRRGRNPVDKEYRRLKRLLRNRVSAQQARERKKVYVNDLESRAKELQDKNLKLEERISTLINENTVLRKVLMSTRAKVDDTIEPKQD